MAANECDYDDDKPTARAVISGIRRWEREKEMQDEVEGDVEYEEVFDLKSGSFVSQSRRRNDDNDAGASSGGRSRLPPIRF